MKRKPDEYVEQDETGPAFGHMELVRVERDFVPLYSGKYGKSIGALADEAIANAVASGVELQDFNLHFERDQWSNVARFYSPPQRAD